MFIERLITFLVLGFFVFVADVGGWWQTNNLIEWYANYIVWIGLIVITYLASDRKDAENK